MNTVSVPPELLTDCLTFVSVSSQATKRAVDEIQVHRQMREKAASLSGPLLDQLVATGLVALESKEAAATMLGSHAETLQLLKAAATKLVDANRLLAAQGSASSLGAGITEKAASAGNGTGATYDSLTSPFVGRSSSASDAELRKILDPPGR